MRTRELIELLRSYPDDTEVRVAACLYETSDAMSDDLPISGMTTDFSPVSRVQLRVPVAPPTVWIFVSRNIQMMQVLARPEEGQQ
jgi:hypothetical protein